MTMNIRRIDDDFSITGQIRPENLAEIAAAGFKAIVCARPDQEEHGQPPFAEVAQAARTAGIAIVHIPVSGAVGDGQAARFGETWSSLPKPVLGYCRSGARAGSLYQTLSR